MERLEKKVNQLMLSMDIIDSHNKHDQEWAICMMDRIREDRQKVEQVQALCKEYERHLEEQEDIFNDLQNLGIKLRYILENFPEGVVTNVINIENEEICDTLKIEGRGLPKNLFNVPSKENTNTVKNTEKKEEKGLPKNLFNVPPSKENSSAVKNSQQINLTVNKMPPSSSKCEPPKVNTQEISINYITSEEFNQLSSYMRGRITMANINEFVDTFNNALNQKYELLKKPKKKKSANEHEQCLVWKDQESGELIGSYFCNADDFDKLCSVKIGNKKYLNIITILRHLKRIREVRNKKIIYYVACF